MDLNVMMREHARAGLQSQLDAAVTNGDTAAATKIADDIAKLAVSAAPKAPPYGDAEIRAELDKQEWFGTDPKKSGRALALGKDMNPRKFATAEAFAAALVKAVEEEFKTVDTAAAAEGAGDGEGEGGTAEGAGDGAGEGEGTTAAGKKPRRTDAPGEGDAVGRAAAGRARGPWTKLADAPREVQAEVKRQADKFVPSNAPKERREAFVSKALQSHYHQHQQKAGKK